MSKDKRKDLKKTIKRLEERIDVLEERVDFLESELEYEETDRGIETIATQEAVARILHLVVTDDAARSAMAARLTQLADDEPDFEGRREGIYDEYFGDEDEADLDDDELYEMQERIFAVDHEESLDDIEYYILDGAINGVPAVDESDDEVDAAADPDEGARGADDEPGEGVVKIEVVQVQDD